MRRICCMHFGAAIFAAAILSPCVPADETSTSGVFQLGLRAVYLDPHNPLLQESQFTAVTMSGKLYPEISGEWFLGRSWSTELSIGAATNFSVSGSAGEGIRLMPFTLTAKYHFLPDARLRPYLGAGLQYTRSSLVDVPQSTYDTIESSTTGFVAQVGVDLQTVSNLYVNADIRYLNGLEPRRGTVQGGLGGEPLKIDPLLYGIGVSYRW